MDRYILYACLTVTSIWLIVTLALFAIYSMSRRRAARASFAARAARQSLVAHPSEVVELSRPAGVVQQFWPRPEKCSRAQPRSDYPVASADLSVANRRRLLSEGNRRHTRQAARRGDRPHYPGGAR